MSLISIENLKLNSIELQKTILDKTTPRNLTIALGCACSSYVTYKLIKFILKKRRYRHIPGPPTKGCII